MVLDDRLVDAVEIVWEQTPTYQGTVVRQAPDELRVIRNYFTRRFWSSLPSIARSASGQSDSGVNGSGFRFGQELDPGEEPFEGVELYDPLDQIYISRPAFNRLMLRFFEMIIRGATEHGHPLLQELRWPEFLAHAETLRGIVAGSNSDSF
ncbi:MAG TPA: hypothetical protein VFS21_23665 [Roseiflexaceae bacterium]|nr:hypothetical protein [Roseiflexaceae bacterium]